MTVDPAKLNISGQTPISFGVIPPVTGNKKGFSGGPSSNNPFLGKNSYGEGLVNSDLSNFSYTLPNGAISRCNTIGIA